jgi:chorismate synthase
LTIVNRDHENWLDRMAPGPLPSEPEALTRPRPGHADLAGGLKYDRRDLRDILERASARETASRVAVGAVCKRFLNALGIDIFAHVVAIGAIQADRGSMPWSDLRAKARASELACVDPDAEVRMKEAIKTASHAGDTLGGVFEVVASGLPVGLGSHVQWDRKLDGRLAQALMSIQAIKGVEIGDGFAAAQRPGSQVHDPIAFESSSGTYGRTSNFAGGLEGGITNGQPLVVRAAMKPIATLRKALASIDIRTREPFEAAFERSDICAVSAASVVGEAMVAITLTDAMLEKFGGDSMREIQRALATYSEQVRGFGL